MKTWSLFPMISAPMPFQMAFDEILFRAVEAEKSAWQTPFIRFYFSSEPWLTVGYSHKTVPTPSSSPDPLNDQRKELRTNGVAIPTCRRITGGGLVLHGKDLIFSIIAKKTEEESFSSVRMSYLKIHEAIKLAFEKLGMPSRFFRCDENLPRGGDCFQYPIATDLAVGTEKIAGGAQKRSAGVLLHQESVKVPKQKEAEDLIQELSCGFETIFQTQLVPVDLKQELMEAAENLAKEKYGILS